MSRERVLQRRLHTLGTLGEAVGALRSLSAQHFRAARAPLASARAYRDEVQRFLAVIDGFGATGVGEGPMGIVLIAADLGLVGDYTASLVRETFQLRAESEPGPLFCVGHRAVSHLVRAGIEPVSVQSAPTSVAGLTGLLIPLVDTLLDSQRAGQLGSLWLVAARFEGAGEYTPVRVRVLPVAPPSDTSPLMSSPYCDSEHLRTVVVREYLYAVLYETLLDALAAEHGKRLVTTETARTWLEERVGAIRRLAAATRREASTQDMLEVSSGSRAAFRNYGGDS